MGIAIEIEEIVEYSDEEWEAYIQEVIVQSLLNDIGLPHPLHVRY